MEIYIPKKYEMPARVLDVPSAWRGIEAIMGDILDRFSVGRDSAIEFGVEYGYSTVILSNFFKNVVGVDTFKGDIHTEDGILDIEEVRKKMPDNVELIESRYQDYKETGYHDLAHVDIVHNYGDTFECGDLAMKHARVVLFHDTESHPEVKRAVEALSYRYQVKFHNYPECYGLGILCQR